MNMQTIQDTMQQYVDNGELSGGALLVRKGGSVVYQNKWGYADISAKKPIEYDSIYRMMSMTKPVVGVGVMKLIEENKLSLDDPISSFLPAFCQMRVAADKRYQFQEGMNMAALLPKMLLFRMNKVKTVPAQREITIRDLLSHSSGLEQGIVGMIAMMKDKSTRESLEAVAEKYSHYALDFQPGTGTGYSPVAGFDLLGRIIEIVTGERVSAYLKRSIFDPLGMTDTGFRLNQEQQNRLVNVYKREKNTLRDVTGTGDDMDGILHRGKDYDACCGGLFSTLTDYDRFAAMLKDGGGTILKPETVALMAEEAPKLHLEPEPGYVWGLGMKLRQDPQRAGSPCTVGTYGWSGAFGTHFFISPKDDLEAVWVTNRTDLNGSGSYISKKIEELVFGIFTGEAAQ